MAWPPLSCGSYPCLPNMGVMQGNYSTIKEKEADFPPICCRIVTWTWAVTTALLIDGSSDVKNKLCL